MIESMTQGTKSTGTNLDCVGAFLDFVDEEGVTNREKIARKQRIIRRVETTDPNKSYEDAEPADGHSLPCAAEGWVWQQQGADGEV